MMEAHLGALETLKLEKTFNQTLAIKKVVWERKIVYFSTITTLIIQT